MHRVSGVLIKTYLEQLAIGVDKQYTIVILHRNQFKITRILPVSKTTISLSALYSKRLLKTLCKTIDPALYNMTVSGLLTLVTP